MKFGKFWKIRKLQRENGWKMENGKLITKQTAIIDKRNKKQQQKSRLTIDHHNQIVINLSLQQKQTNKQTIKTTICIEIFHNFPYFSYSN